MGGLMAITGADGFIGSHLAEAAVRAGHRVRAMVQYNAFDGWGWLDEAPADVREHLEVVAADVRDPRSVRSFLEGADTVLHLAALIAIPFSYRAPASYLATNGGGTLNVLEAVRELETPRLVHTSTSEVYGTARHVPMNEHHPLQAQSPYAASKIAADKLVEAYHLSFGLPVVTVRPFNTFGPRQSARAVIPAVVSQVAAGQPRIAIGATSPTRDFTFVGDTVAAFLAVATAPIADVVGRTFNAGTGVETLVGDLPHLVAEILGRRVEVFQEAKRLRPTASEVQRLVCDAAALRAATGWAPDVPFLRGLERTCAWFLEPGRLDRYRPARYAL